MSQTTRTDACAWPIKLHTHFPAIQASQHAPVASRPGPADLSRAALAAAPALASAFGVGRRPLNLQPRTSKTAPASNTAKGATRVGKMQKTFCKSVSSGTTVSHRTGREGLGLEDLLFWNHLQRSLCSVLHHSGLEYMLSKSPILFKLPKLEAANLQTSAGRYPPPT